MHFSCSAEQHQCLCGQLQLEQGRESLVKYAQQEKIAEDGEHQTLASSPGLTVIRTLGTLSPNKLPKGPKPPKPTHVRVEAKTDKRAEGSKCGPTHEPKGPVAGGRFRISESSKAIKFGDAQNPRGTLGRHGVCFTWVSLIV